MFKKATKTQSRLRLALIGVAGSGKTYTALKIASALGEKIAVIDTEHHSASKYADLTDFDSCELESFSPLTYINAIQEAGKAGYDVLVIDSLSHAWMGKDGALEQVDRIAKRSQSGNSFNAWRDVTPLHNQLIEAMISCPCHLIVTMRAKTEYVVETNEKGKSAPRKVGLAPVQRDGLEYEFDVVAEMTTENDLIISKSRCPSLSGQIISKPDAKLGLTLKDWLTDGAPIPVVDSVLPGNQATVAEKIDQTSAELKRLGWSTVIAQRFLQDTYQKSSRNKLTEEELDSFLAHLRNQDVSSDEPLTAL
jgi:hypothetical protein